MVVPSYSKPCTWTEESVVGIKWLPTNTLGGKVRYWPSVSKGKAVSKALFVEDEIMFFDGLRC